MANPAPSSQLPCNIYRDNCGKIDKAIDPLMRARREKARLRKALELVPPPLQSKHPIAMALACCTDAMVLVDRGEYVLLPIACGRKFCIRCAERWSDILTSKLLPRATAAKDGTLRHIVFTVPNAAPTRLAMRMDQLKIAWRDWRAQGRKAGWWAPEGYHAKYEITHGIKKGWHPHLHVLAHSPKGINLTKRSEARKAWLRITDRLNCRATGIYITRPHGRAAAREVAKYAAKPAQLDGLPSKDLVELAEALHRRRMHASDGTLRADPETAEKSKCIYIGQLSRETDELKCHLPYIAAQLLKNPDHLNRLLHMPSIVRTIRNHAEQTLGI